MLADPYEAGLTLCAGCSGALLLGDAGLLEGANVIAHPERLGNCRIGGRTVPPMVDGRLATAAGQRGSPMEITVAITRSLDADSMFSPFLDLITALDLEPLIEEVECSEATSNWRTGGGECRPGAIAPSWLSK